MDKENKLILYKDDEGKVNVNVRFADEDVWLTQAQLAVIYNTTQQNISLHQKGIYADGELDESVTHKKYLLVRQEGKRQVQREIDFAKRLIFIDKVAKNAIITMTFDRNLGILTQISNLLLFLHT